MKSRPLKNVGYSNLLCIGIVKIKHRPRTIKEVMLLSVFDEKRKFSIRISITIGHFTVVYSVTRPMNGSEAAGDLVLIQTSLFLSCKSCCCDAN